MRRLYWDEAPIDTLLQVEKGPTRDGDLISKTHRSEFFRLGWIARCEGYNIITPQGREVIHALRLARMPLGDEAKQQAHTYAAIGSIQDGKQETAAWAESNERMQNGESVSAKSQIR